MFLNLLLKANTTLEIASITLHKWPTGDGPNYFPLNSIVICRRKLHGDPLAPH